MREAFIVAGIRTAVGKAPTGSLRYTRPDETAAAVLKGVLVRAGQLDPADVDDVIFGCAYPEAEQGRNVARIAALRAGFPVSVPGTTVNRFCASGLEAIAIASQRIQCGGAEIIIAGGAETMTLIPRGGNNFSPNPYLAEHWPGVYISMGLTAERVADAYQIARADQDRFAVSSHAKASAALAAGKFQDEILPLSVVQGAADDGSREPQTGIFERDEGVRPDCDLAALAKLRPAFKAGGSVTAGNSSQMSDGAAALVVMDGRQAQARGLGPLARLVGYAVAGVAPELMGLGPVAAVPKVLRQTGLSLADIDLIELNEAFACQALAVIRELELDVARVNVNGGAIALGHPLGCTGAKLTLSIIGEMRRRGARYGLVTMCVGGGQGAAAIFERLA
jgi:acetyl-CoA acyltransferase